MKRVSILAALVAVFAAFSIPATASAVTKSCSPSNKGAEKVPAIDNVAGTVSETGEQGYNCTVAWDMTFQPQFENSGLWYDCTTDNIGTPCPPGFHPFGTTWPSGTAFDWPFGATGHLTEPLWVFTIGTITGSAPDVPVCAVNWRLQLTFVDSGGSIFQNGVSPTLHKSC